MAALLSVGSIADAAPGAISSTLRISSVNNILSTFVPILSYYILNNKTMTLDFEESGFGYKIDIDSIHLNTVDGWKVKDIEFLDDKNTVRVHYSGINVNSQIDGQITALWLIKLHMAQCNITNLDVQVDFAIDAEDALNWKIVSSSVLAIDDITITTTSSWFNYLLGLMHKTILKMVRENLPKAEAEINKIFTDFNTKYAERDDMTFMVNILKSNYNLLNLTTSTAPSLSEETGLLSLNFDGLFYNTNDKSTHITKPNTVQPPRYDHSHSEQFWLHESMINSLFLTMTEGKLPIDVSNKNITDMITLFNPELKKFYGDDAEFELYAEL